MSRDNGFAFLKEQGAEEIVRRTHIISTNVDKLLNRSFDKLSKVQFNGFLSILEREYEIDLSDYRAELQAFYAQHEVVEKVEDVFEETASDQRKNRKVYIGFAVTLIIVVVGLIVVYMSSSEPKSLELNNTAIDKAKETMKYVAISSAPGTESYEVDTVQNHQLQQQQQSSKSSEVVESVTHEDVILIPTVRIWLGIIDMQTRKRRIETTSERVRLDGSKEWLIVTGHGRLRVEQGDKEFRYKKRNQMLFMVKDGLFQKIDEAEFKARNRGRIW